ncbi:MAG: hypothetical protein JXR76_26200 [Deltaproteobacteria bacterium]|nr:hypothetical protein [Deltaproteobacteria bacterium]
MHDAMSVFKSMANDELPSRVPAIINLIDQGATELGLSSEEYYSRAENVVEGQLRLHRKYGHDVVWGAHYIARIAEMLGARKTLFPTVGPPNVGDLVIKQWDDIERLEIPADDMGLIDDSAKKIRHAVRTILLKGAKGVGFAFGTLMMPCQIPEKNIHEMIQAVREFGTYDIQLPQIRASL